MSGHWGDYPPGSDHQPRGDTPEANQRFRDGWDRMFGGPSNDDTEPDVDDRGHPETFGYQACWEGDGGVGRCRLPLGHEGEHAFVPFTK